MSDDKGTNSVITREEGTSTEQSQHEELLRARNYLDLVEVIFVGLDTKGVVVFANRKCCKVLGYDHNEAIGKDWFKTFIPKKVRKETYDVFRSLMKGKTELVEHFENPILTKDGEERIIAWHNTLLTDEAGSITGTLSSGEDITDRKEAEEQLRTIEEKHKQLFETSQDGIVYADMDGNYLDVNQGFLNIVGYDREELLSKTYLDITPKKWASAEAEIDKTQVKVRGYSDEYEKEYICKDGTLVPVSARIWLIKDDADRPLYNIAIVRDITERKRAEEALIESEEKYRTTLENIEDGYYEVDLSGNFTFFNKSLGKILGYSEEELAGMNYGSYTKEDHTESVFQTFNKVYRTKKPTEIFDWEIIRKDGTARPIEASISLIVDSAGEPVGFRGIIRDITDRKRFEVQIRSERDRLQSLMDGLSLTKIGLDIIDMDYRILSQNRILTERFGESIGTLCYETYMGLEKPCDNCPMENAIETGDVQRAELKGSDGKDYEISSAPFINPDGTVDKVIEIVRDITERKRAEEKLHESEERYRVLVETMNDGLGVIDRNRRFTFVNVCFAEMLGYSPEEMIGRPITDFIDTDNLNILTENIGKRKEGVSSAYELAWTTKTGAEITSIVSGSSLVDKDGTHLGSFAIITDITERKKSEKALQESEQRYRELIDMLPQGVVAADLNEKIDLVNKEMCNILGYGSEELMGRSFVDFVDPRDAEKMTAQTARRTHGVFSSYDLRMIHKTGEVRDVQVSAAPVRNDAGKIDRAIGVFMDITESKRNEELRRQQHSELEVYASLIRHDLRNDVGIILGNVDLAKMIAGENDSEILQTLSSTEAACERMTNLLKAVSGSADTIEKNIVALVSSVSAQAQDAHTKLTVNVTVNDDAEELTIMGNRLLPMVFENLLRNAASHAGEKPIVDIAISKEGSNVQVLVSDNGPGVPEKVRDRLFSRGASTSGGGLGLYLSREIVNAMNGSIELLDTDSGEGAAFRILLPLTM